MPTTVHQHRRRMALLGLLYAGTGVLAVGLIWGVLSIYSLTHAIRQTQQTNSSTNHAILDCTQPKGKCYRQGQQRTAEAVDNIGRLSVYASACAADVDPSLPVRQRVSAIEQCVRELLSKPPAVP